MDPQSKEDIEPGLGGLPTLDRVLLERRRKMPSVVWGPQDCCSYVQHFRSCLSTETA